MKEYDFSSDDLHYALSSNTPLKFKAQDVTHILAEVCGEHDGYDWWWIIKLTNERYFLISGGCDYTGWDCQSSTVEHGFFSSPEECAKNAPEVEEYSGRRIRETLLNQLSGKIAFGVYYEKNKDK